MNDDSTSLAHRDESGRINKNSLVARAGVVRTFGGVGGFLAITFLGAGVYLLQEALSDPLRAQAVGLIAGAFILALSTMLLYFLLSPRPGYRRRKARRRGRWTSPQPHVGNNAAIGIPAETAVVLPVPALVQAIVPDSTAENAGGLPLPA